MKNILITAALACAWLSPLASAQHHHAADHKQEAKQAQAAPETIESQPYTLPTCPVSGQALGSMGDPIIKQIDGREVRFCCAMCPPKFQKNKAEHFKKIDEQMIADQLPHYPLTTCVVSGEKLSDEGEHAAINVIYKNRLVRFCCQMCQDDFNKDPGAYLAKLDAKAADQQREHYPLTTCMVSGGELGGMGEPSEIIPAGRLIRFCCAMCEPKVLKNPTEFIAKLDEAWRAAKP